jgi:excisionase family DNA binding protein
METEARRGGAGGNDPPTPVRLRSVREVADEILHVSRNTLYTLIYERQLKATKCGRQWRISDRDLLEFLGQAEEVRR